MTQLSDFAANQPKPGTVPVSRYCPGCGHDFHSAGNCHGLDVEKRFRCPCERNMAVSLDITPPESPSDTIARLEAENARLAALATQTEKRAEDREQEFLDFLQRQKERREVQQRPDHAVLVSIAALAEEQLTQLKHILKQLQTAAESRNVVEIDSNGSAGKIKVRVRCTGETLADAHMTALEQFAQAMAEVEAGQVNGWLATVEMLQAKNEIPAER